jgi:hypothetical protein
MGYICGGFVMHGHGIVTPIEVVMRLVRVGLEYETSSLDENHSGPSSTNLHKSRDSEPSIDDIPTLESLISNDSTIVE